MSASIPVPVLRSPAAHSAPHQRGRVVRKPSPAGYCLPPTTELTKSERGPISTSVPSMPVCHQTGRFLRENPLNFSLPPSLDAVGRLTIRRGRKRDEGATHFPAPRNRGWPLLAIRLPMGESLMPISTTWC